MTERTTETAPPGWHVEWCREMFDLLAEGGVWGIPRSGLLFRKEGEGLVLHESMPWMPGLPMSEAELKTYQDGEFEIVKLHFGLAGIVVRR